jgi:hypothetical protein
MESNREVFLRMSEEHYLTIPSEVRESFLSDKRVDEEKGDWSENMKDAVFAQCNKAIREDKKRMSEREYQLREERRKVTIK